MALGSKERFQLRKIIHELENYRGQHTELVTVYIPAEYDIVKITQHLAQEADTASNIKSTSTRKNVEAALEKMIQHLKLYKKNTASRISSIFRKCIRKRRTTGCKSMEHRASSSFED